MNLLNHRKSIPVSLGQHKHNNPFSLLQNELNKVVSDLYGWFEPYNFPKERFENLTLSPAIDIVDEKDHFKIEVEMPGMSEEDVNVFIDHGILTIRGEKSISKKDKGKNYMSREINYGIYERSVSLPDAVDVDQAKASFKKGMLWVYLPKKAEYTKKCCTVNVEKAD